MSENDGFREIYLQRIEDGEEHSTWCQDKINDSDIAYIRKDIADEMLEALIEVVKIIDPDEMLEKDVQKWAKIIEKATGLNIKEVLSERD